MQREVIDGIPFWCDKENNLYYYDINTAAPKNILIGTKTAANTANLRADWEQQIASILAQYRAETVPRTRKPPAKA